MECDSLNSIALKFDTTPSEIARLNKKPPGLSFSLFPGEVRLLHFLLLPGTLCLAKQLHSTLNQKLTNHEDKFWFDDVVTYTYCQSTKFKFSSIRLRVTGLSQTKLHYVLVQEHNAAILNTPCDMFSANGCAFVQLCGLYIAPFAQTSHL